MIVIWQGATISSASDIYEPIAVLWSLGAIAGMFALSWRWEQRRQVTGGAAADGPADGPADGRSSVAARRSGFLSRLRRPRLPSMAYLAGLTGGFYFCHVLFINTVRAALYSSFIGGSNLPWPIRSAIFYVGTAVLAVTFASLITRTPLRWVLGGPVRAEQRERDNAEVAIRAARAARATDLDSAGAGDGGGSEGGDGGSGGASIRHP
jgi:hypothetical protein